MIPEHEFGFASVTAITSMPGFRELVLTDISEYGATLLREVDPSTEESILSIAAVLGSLELGVDPELSGPAVMDIRHDAAKAMASQRAAYFTVDQFPLHTDLSFVSSPPRYVMLHCVVPDLQGGGVSLLADCKRAFGELTETDQSVLSEHIFNFFYSVDPARESGVVPVYLADGGREMWRFRLECMIFPASAAHAVTNFRDVLDGICFRRSLAAGDMLIFDNHRMVHGRTAVKPSAVSPGERHLRRTYVRATD